MSVVTKVSKNTLLRAIVRSGLTFSVVVKMQHSISSVTIVQMLLYFLLYGKFRLLLDGPEANAHGQNNINYSLLIGSLLK